MEKLKIGVVGKGLKKIVLLIIYMIPFVFCIADCRGTIVLVGQDGVQRPPIHFPKGGHLLAFLSCLETGLLPHGQLDPPLWSQRGKGIFCNCKLMRRFLKDLILNLKCSLKAFEEKEGAFIQSNS